MKMVSPCCGHAKGAPAPELLCGAVNGNSVSGEEQNLQAWAFKGDQGKGGDEFTQTRQHSRRWYTLFLPSAFLPSFRCFCLVG